MTRKVLFAALLIVAAPAAAGGARHYTITDLGSPGAALSFGRAINSAGVVAGSFWTGAGTTPFYAAPGQAPVAFAAATTAYDFSEATGINAAGQISGTLVVVGGSTAFRYTIATGQLETLMPVVNDDGSLGMAINADGTVAGTSIQARGPRGNLSANHAYVAPTGGAETDIGSIDGGFTEGHAINNLGQVAGQSVIENGSEHGAAHAFVYTPGIGVVDIDPFGSSSHAWAINDAGQVAGYAFTPDRDYRRAFLYTPGQGSIMLNRAGDTSAYSAWGINNFGVVVGGIEGDDYDGFVYDGQRTLILDSLIDNLAPDAHVLSAYAINDAGQITGDAYFGDTIHAFRLDPAGIGPVPEPATWGLMVAGFGLVGTAVRRRSLRTG